MPHGTPVRPVGARMADPLAVYVADDDGEKPPRLPGVTDQMYAAACEVARKMGPLSETAARRIALVMADVERKRARAERRAS